MKPTNEELQAALDGFKRLYAKVDVIHTPKPTLEDFGRVAYMNETAIIKALKFTMAANEPLKRTIYDAGAHAMHAEKDRLKETWGRTTDQYADTLSILAFRAMTAKIWEEMK